MPEPVAIRLPADPQAIAPDGTRVRLLPTLPGGSLAHFTLAAGATSLAVQHRNVEENNTHERETLPQLPNGVSWGRIHIGIPRESL